MLDQDVSDKLWLYYDIRNDLEQTVKPKLILDLEMEFYRKLLLPREIRRFIHNLHLRIS